MSDRKMGSRRTASRRPARSGEKGSAAPPSLRFHYPEELHTEVLELLVRLERAEDPKPLAKELARLVGRLTECGLDYYFLLPLREAQAGFLAERSASMGVASAMKVLEPLLRGVVGRLDADQLRVVAGHLRGLMD